MAVSRSVSYQATSEPRRSPKPSARPRRRHAARKSHHKFLAWEMAGRLTVNIVLGTVALVTLIRLVPYYQTQRFVLRDTQDAVATATATNKRLRAEFSRYFDPAQTSRAMQENGTSGSGRHIPIVLVDPLKGQSGSSAEE